eukprot:7145710-Pyramimonas_sp.AAC.2
MSTVCEGSLQRSLGLQRCREMLRLGGVGLCAGMLVELQGHGGRLRRSHCMARPFCAKTAVIYEGGRGPMQTPAQAPAEGAGGPLGQSCFCASSQGRLRGTLPSELGDPGRRPPRRNAPAGQPKAFM